MRKQGLKCEYIGCVIHPVRCPVEDESRTGFQFMSEAQNCLCPNRRCSQTCDLFVGFGVVVSAVIKNPAREADSLLQASDEVQNVWSSTSLPPYTHVTFSVVVPKAAQEQFNLSDS
jgi:hypothetical protein